MPFIQKGCTVFFSTPPIIVQGIVPSLGAKTADLLAFNSTHPQRVNLSFLGGECYVPDPTKCESFVVQAHLFRAVADVNGITDCNCSIELLQFAGTQAIGNTGTAAFSNGHCFPTGALVESVGVPIEVPNILEADGTWGNFCWQMSGNTVLGSAVWLELVRVKLVPGYTLPSPYPAKVPAATCLAMYFGAGYTDVSPSAHTITATGMTSTTESGKLLYDGGGSTYLNFDGSAVFNGSSSYLSLNASDIILSGDFTIEIAFSTTHRAAQGNCAQRLLSFGNASIAVGIDQTSGAVALFRENVATLYTGGNAIDSGYVMTAKWRRASGVNTLIVNGQQDGPSFNDATIWTLGSDSMIGRYCGSAVGFYTGKIHSLSIVNGLAV